MGCDIHLVLERRKVAFGRWIGVYSSDTAPGGRPEIARRDYAFFAAVAAVRSSGYDGPKQYPRNLPEDVSELSWASYMECPTDYHSASHMSLQQFTDIYLSVNPKNVRGEFAAHDLLGAEDHDGKYEFRVVFWFDN